MLIDFNGYYSVITLFYVVMVLWVNFDFKLITHVYHERQINLYLMVIGTTLGNGIA